MAEAVLRVCGIGALPLARKGEDLYVCVRERVSEEVGWRIVIGGQFLEWKERGPQRCCGFL